MDRRAFAIFWVIFYNDGIFHVRHKVAHQNAFVGDFVTSMLRDPQFARPYQPRDSLERAIHVAIICAEASGGKGISENGFNSMLQLKVGSSTGMNAAVTKDKIEFIDDAMTDVKPGFIEWEWH